jgi:hypothetical protein
MVDAVEDINNKDTSTNKLEDIMVVVVVVDAVDKKLLFFTEFNLMPILFFQKL